MGDELLSITEVGEATGLAASTLRYYERAGLLSPAARIGGRRHYSPDVLHRLRIIGLLQEVGFTIGEIGEVINRAGSGGWRSLARAKLDEIDEHIRKITQARELLVAALECGCSGLEHCELVNRRRGRHERVIRTLSFRSVETDAGR